MASNGTGFAAFTIVALGVWLIDSGIQGRHPISTLEDILRNPSNTRATLTADKGQFGTVQGTLGGAVQSGTYKTVNGQTVFVPDGSSLSTAPAPAAPTSKQVAAEEKYAAGQLSKYGWDQSQMPALIDLWNRESGWNPYAVNPGQTYNGDPSSLPKHAHGIPQSLGHSETDTDSWMRNWKAQIDWGLSYIKNRYGSPDAAWNNEVSQGSY